jgi:uncharacterized repeat protein (TIGR02543 family)
LTTNAFTRTGYTFTGWNTAANGSGTSYANDVVYPFVASVTLYAQWTETSITVPLGGENSNWSGYILPTTSLDTLARGEWTVPTLNCADTPNGDSSTWVGTGGDTWSNGTSSGALLQTGVEDNCENGVQVDSGWFELLPSTPNYAETFSDFPVSPGNTIEASVGDVNGQWGTLLSNLSTGLTGFFFIGQGWGISETAGYSVISIQGQATGTSYYGAYSVEWIEEDVTSAASGSLFTFPNYVSVTFFNLGTSITTGWSLTNSDSYEIVGSNGAVLSVPGAVIGDGFTVTYTGP